MQHEVSRTMRHVTCRGYMHRYRVIVVIGVQLKKAVRFVTTAYRLVALWIRSRSSNGAILYVLTPPPTLANVGDHAQAVAIIQWLERLLPDTPWVELDKKHVPHLFGVLRHFVRAEYDIVVHSGGNMGDLGVWSEGLRTKLVRAFPNNRIISLPQTVSFSDTAEGRQLLRASISAYESHRNLVLVARDHRSLELARTWFRGATVDICPDFVLNYDYSRSSALRNGRCLLCLRHDSESVIDAEAIQTKIEEMDMEWDPYDTTLSKPIRVSQRSRVLHETLHRFARYSLVVTDRFHGLIFAVLARTPVVVLPTVDHKLESGVEWFEGFDRVVYCEDLHIARCAHRAVNASTSQFDTRGFFGVHFDRLSQYLTRQAR